ncbi:MAG: tRNA (adenosine(37)-N6)-dimethylallyltransferase MiaA [Pyrinomonadaceae bacterium]
MTDATQNTNPVFAIVGPTASGKSALGVELALKFNGEVINCDSVQVYREIEIATAKLPFKERRGVPHHLIDFVSPAEKYTAGDWAKDAAATIDDIESRNRCAFIVGGSGLYLRALTRPFFASPQTDEHIRRRLLKLREERGADHLYKLLVRLDPKSAARFHRRDWSRVQRALEYRLQTGKVFAEEQSRQDFLPSAFASRLRIFALNPLRAALYERINQRTEEHFQQGLVEEVKALLEKGVPHNSSAPGAHGYRRIAEYVRGDEGSSLEGALEQTKLDIRHYAKRQLTWFRREQHVIWINGFGDDGDVQREVAAIIESILRHD